MAEEKPTRVHAPIIIDLGKHKKKKIKRLKRGRGKLMREVEYVVEEVQRDLGEEAAGKDFIPIVMIYRRKRRKRKKRGISLFPLLPF